MSALLGTSPGRLITFITTVALAVPLVGVSTPAAQAAPGDPVTSFNTTIGTTISGGLVYAVATQPDGKIVVGGSFTAPARFLARFNEDGTPDTAFNTASAGVNGGYVRSLAIQPDGKIVAGGSFTAPSRYVARFASTGAPDTAFNDNANFRLWNQVLSVALQSDGKILAGGEFTAANSPANRLVRFNDDGSLDTAFNTAVGTTIKDDAVNSVVVQSDGKIVVGGQFLEPSNFLARFNSTGSPDTSFNSNVGTTQSGRVYAMTQQSTGKILIGGAETFARYNSNGTRDSAFSTAVGSLNGAAYAVVEQPDGKLLIGGDFASPSGRLARYSANGTADTAFNTRVGNSITWPYFGTDGSQLRSIGLTPTGNIVVGGQLSTPAGSLAEFEGDWKSSQTITFGALTDKYRMQSPVTVSATASSGLTVSFSSQTEDVCTVSGSTVTFVGTGTCTIRASQSGNALYLPAPDVDQSFIVDPNNPPQPASLNCIDKVLQWPSVRRAQSYTVVYRVKNSDKPWGIYAGGSNQTSASMTNTGTRKQCSAANSSRGVRNCAMPYQWSNGKTYEFAVYTTNTINRNSVVPLASQLTFTATSNNKPPTPDDLVAQALDGAASIEFTLASQCSAALTNLEYQLDNGAWTALDPADTTSPVTIPGLTNGQTYSIRLRPTGTGGNGNASGPVEVTPTIAAPGAMSATAGDGSLSISFTEPDSAGVANYQYSLDSGAWTALDPADTTSPVTIPGLTNGQTYSVRLRAVSASGPGTASDPLEATPTVAAPTALSATAGNGSLSISFTAPNVTGITNYQYRLDNGSWTALSPADTTSPVTISGLTNSTSYAVRLRAVKNGVGTASDPVYGRPTTSDIAPSARIVGSSTGLSGANQVATDSDGNIYVADLGNSAIRVFAKGATGNVAPIRTISGANTGLSSPNGVAIGPNGLIYATSNGNSSVRVFAADASGNATPVRVISGANTGLAWPYYLDVDADGKIYVANRNDNSIRVFATGADGNVAPTRTIVGANTLLYLPLGVQVGSDGTIYTSNESAVNIFAPGANGNVAPTRRISGSNTGFTQLYGIAVSDTGVVYTMDRPNKRISAFSAGANGNVAPARTITGALTLFSDPVGLHWTADEYGLGGTLYVGDRGANSVSLFAP